MSNDDALHVLGQLEAWGWQKPPHMSENEFWRILEGCLSFLTDSRIETTAQTWTILAELTEKSNQRLFAFLPEFRRRFERANAAQQQINLQDALNWSSNRFERMIIENFVNFFRQASSAGLVDANLTVDDLIIRAAHKQWQKVAMVVGTVMISRQGLIDTAIAERVTVLVENGMLEAQGDLSDMRFSEVRLTEDASSTSSGSET